MRKLKTKKTKSSKSKIFNSNKYDTLNCEKCEKLIFCENVTSTVPWSQSYCTSVYIFYLWF